MYLLKYWVNRDGHWRQEEVEVEHLPTSEKELIRILMAEPVLVQEVKEV